MDAGSVIITGKWLVPAAIVCALAVVVVSLAYRRIQPARVTVPAMLLKHLGLVLLAACLLDPLWSRTVPQQGANLLAVVADNSRGMELRDDGQTRSRGEALKAALTGAGARWLDRAGERFQVRSYTVDRALRRIGDFGEMHFDGDASSLATAVRTLADRYSGRPLAGIVLLTDGNATDLTDAAIDTAGLPPIYPVVVGAGRPPRDLAITAMSVSQSAFEDAPVTAQVEVAALGYAERDIQLNLIDEAGKVMETKAQRVGGAVDVSAFRFQVKPEKPGVHFYRVIASAAGAKQGGEREEATLANNSRTLVVDRGRGPHRVLYVGGRPNWEYKFLRRAIETDAQVQLVGLIRIARKEPKFEFRGRTGESSNPLFRGFDRKTDETQRYDQPVLVRLNTADDSELRDGFPASAEALFGYKAVIIDDVEAEFFTREQLTLLQRFVSQRGGGVLMLGGVESFAHGGYARTPVGDMLPVYLDGVPLDEGTTNVRLNLTREGWVQPWARLRSHEDAERTRIEEMPPFLSLNQVRGVKPGASVVATVNDPTGGVHPALVVQRYGGGRSAALMLGDMWHWGLTDEARHEDMDKAWRQMVRWLVADVPGPIDLRVEHQNAEAGGAVTLVVRARDAKFDPLDNAGVTVEVTPVGGQAIKLPAEASSTEAGAYTAVYLPRAAGGYRAKAVVKDPSGKAREDAEAGWVTDAAAEEFKSLEPNRAWLKTLARQTGGEMLELADVSGLPSMLESRRAPVVETVTQPLWHRSSVFLLAIGCLVGEWTLRRWKGLP